MAFTKRDSELFDILAQATKDELILLSKIISEKWSSNIDEFCTDPYKITKEIQLMGGIALLINIEAMVLPIENLLMMQLKSGCKCRTR